jgi:hypothetical protein
MFEHSTGNYRGGCRDIFAWRDSDMLFVESKQDPMTAFGRLRRAG